MGQCCSLPEAAPEQSQSIRIYHLQTEGFCGPTDRNATTASTADTTDTLDYVHPPNFDNMVPKKKTYGAKRTTNSSAANSIFGRNVINKEAAAPSRAILSDITHSAENIVLKEDPKQADDTDDVADALDRFKLHDDAEKKESHDCVGEVARGNSVANKENNKEGLRPHGPPRSPDATLADSTKSCDDSDKNHGHESKLKAKSVAKGDEKEQDAPSPNPSTITLHFRDREILRPLTYAYKLDRGVAMSTHSWPGLLPFATYSVQKIAEASFAEVYRIIERPSACIGRTPRSSILKVMRLQSRRDQPSMELNTAGRVEDVVSEIRIMNALTVIPGYVKFKEAYIVQGFTVPYLTKAWEDHAKAGEAYFPHPGSYTEKSLFLVIELGDAGTTLDDYQLKNVDEAWDIFLGTVLALAKAEDFLTFEHRDLHESNICVSTIGTATPRSPGSPPKYGNAGLEVTLIDYGLSRATLEDGRTLYFPLENDLGIFQGTNGHPQFDAYRKMRNYLFTGHRVSERKAWHDEESRLLNNGHTWDEFIPYTNVIWLRYFLAYLKKQCAAIPGWTDDDQKTLLAETKTISKAMDVRTKEENGAFMTAGAVLRHCVDVGLIDVEQGGFDTSEVIDE